MAAGQTDRPIDVFFLSIGEGTLPRVTSTFGVATHAPDGGENRGALRHVYCGDTEVFATTNSLTDLTLSLHGRIQSGRPLSVSVSS